MKVSLVLGSIPGGYFWRLGGASKHCYYLAKELLNCGVEVEIVGACVRKEMKTGVYGGVKYIFIPTLLRRQNVFTFLLYPAELIRYFKRNPPDIIHSYSYFATYLYLHLPRHKPTIVQEFGVNFLYYLPPELQGTLLSRLRAKLMRYLWASSVARADLIACEGESQTPLLTSHGVEPEKIVILPQGFPGGFIDSALETYRMTRQQLGLAEDDFVLISVNRFDRIRSFNELLKAVSLVASRLPKVKLLLIGAVQTNEEQMVYREVREMVKRLQLERRVFCFPNVPEETIYSYYKLADLYISATLYENPVLMGILEGMYCGLPVVSTGQEAIVKHGENGFLVPKQHPIALADAILKAWESDLKQMGAASRKIAQSYDYRQLVKKYITIYADLISKKGIRTKG